MDSGSKREKVKAFFRRSHSPRKSTGVSNYVHIDTPTPSLSAHSSGVGIAVDEPSPSADVPETAVAKSSSQVLGPRTNSTGNIFGNAHHFTVNEPVLAETYNKNTVNIRGASDERSKASKPFSKLTTHESSPSTGVPKTTVVTSSNPAFGPRSSSSGDSFGNASHFVMNKPIIAANYTRRTINIHGTSAMQVLSEHTIRGAAHDSSARDPLPRCHPGTRIEINDHIITWFYDKNKRELLIWVYGHAGVGKSAIMQTLADKLAKSKHLGASVFISRPNGRNSSKQLFLTIGYQLAAHIEDYCTFITEKLARDPELVDKGIEEQFKIFIVEPFVERKVGAGANLVWGILLDGLDELDEFDEPRWQKEIIRLIANFVLKHPDVPLLWAIASRPEPYICDTFAGEKVMPAYWKKHVTTNRRDVKRFLRDNLERIRNDFPRAVSKQWPSKAQISSLVAGAAGLFIFADTAIRFIEDAQHANPALRLNQVLSALSGVTATSNDEPFIRLNALYASILNAIPHVVWQTTKRVFGVLLYAGREKVDVLKRLAAISIVLGLDLKDIYASVNGCYSLLRVSDPDDANSIPVDFYHTSFGDYLLNSVWSQTYHISLGDVEEDLLKSSLDVWRKFKEDYPLTPGLTYQNRWLKYLSLFVCDEQSDPTFLYKLMQYIHEALFTFLVKKHQDGLFSSEEDRNQCFNLLSQLEDATICGISWGINRLVEFLPWLFGILEGFQDELVSRGIIQVGKLEQAQIFQIGTYVDSIELICDKSQLESYTYNAADFDELIHQISHLGSCFPKLPVFVCGSPGCGCLFLRHQITTSDLYPSSPMAGAPFWRYFTIPFPQSDFYNNAKHFLKVSLEKIQANYSHVVPSRWPSKKQFLKLASAVAHQSMFASTAIRFIENPHKANPTAHLDQLLALIDEVDPSDDQPFIYVDALYTHILNSIPSNMWPTTQQVLGALLYSMPYNRSSLKSPKGISVIFGIELNVVYAALNDCYPMVLLPPENTFLGSITFCSASFCEYLVDPTRSKKFHISEKETRSHILELLINMWQDSRKKCHNITSQSMWNKYCSQYHPNTGPSDLMIIDFNDDLLHDTHEAPFTLIRQYGPAELESAQIRDQVFSTLSQLDHLTVSKGFWWWTLPEFVPWLFDIWDTHQQELTIRGLFHEIQFQKLQVDHQRKVGYHKLRCNAGRGVQEFFGQEPKSEMELEAYIAGLQLFQKHRPHLQVLIGGTLGNRFALFEYEYTEDDLGQWLHYPVSGKLKSGDLGYYVLPCPDDV